MTKVRAACSRARSRTSRAWRPIRNRISSGSPNGVGPPSTMIANVASSGGGVVLVEGVDPLLDADAGADRARCRRRRSAGRCRTTAVSTSRANVETRSSSGSTYGIGARVLVGDPAVRRGLGLSAVSAIGGGRLGAVRVRGRLMMLRIGGVVRPTGRPTAAGTRGDHESRGRPGRRTSSACAWRNLPAGSRGDGSRPTGRGRHSGPAGPGAVATSAPSGRSGRRRWSAGGSLILRRVSFAGPAPGR